MKKNIENSDMPISRPTTLDPRSERSRKIENGTSGWRDAFSMTANSPSSPSDSAPSTSVCVDVQPALLASTRA